MSRPRSPVRHLALLSAVLILPFFLSSPHARSAPTASISLKPNTGPPTIPVSVKGQGFGPSEVVDVTFDATLLGKATTSPAGTFHRRVKVPRTATPGTHTVTATGETSGETAQASFLVRTNWPRYHFDNANTGYNRYENVVSADNVETLVQKWAVPTAGGGAPSPIVAYGRVYVAPTDGIVRALDPATGALLWSFDTGGTMSGTAPTAANSLIYVGNDNGEVFALSAPTGTVTWSRHLGAMVAGSPIVNPDALYVGVFTNAGDVLYWLEPLTGATYAAFNDVSFDRQPSTLAYGLVYTEPGIGCNVDAFDASTGRLVWFAHFCDEGAIGESVVAANGRVFKTDQVGTNALDPATGATQWMSTQVGWVAPSVANGVVFAAAFGPFALDAATGSVLWEASGADVAESAPIVANGVVYLGERTGVLQAYCADNGALLWTSPVAPTDYTGDPAISDGMLFASTADGTVYAFGLP
jgi:outer membrane protein assembly factor BamB